MPRPMLLARALLTALACCAVATAAVPSAASAAAGTVQKSGNTLFWTGVDDPLDGDYVSVYVIDNGTPANPGDDKLILYHENLVFTGEGCTQHGTPPKEVRCPFTEISRLVLEGRAGADYLEVTIDRPGFTVEGQGGEGNDFLVAYGFGTALTFRGGRGADYIAGSAGADTLDGEDDNDTLVGHGGDDTFTGGAGFDSVSYADNSAADAVDVTIDGAANDGSRAKSEKDNVGVDVEDIEGTEGDDSIIGGTGANTLDGGEGNDTLEGRGGFDSFSGGPGVDLINSRDGNSERINCGEGADTAFTDTRDTHTACETVNPSSELEPDKDGDGVEAPVDCDDRNPNVRPGRREIPNNGLDDDCADGDRKTVDADGDGFFVPQDCNDANKGQSPGRPEIYGNDVDEDCNHKKDPLIAFTSRVLGSWRHKQGTFRVATLFIINPAPNATVTIICTGGKKKGCPFRKRKRKIPASTRQFRLESGLRKARLKPGAKLDIRMLRKDAIGRVTILKFRKNKSLPNEIRRCMDPDDKRPRKC